MFINIYFFTDCSDTKGDDIQLSLWKSSKEELHPVKEKKNVAVKLEWKIKYRKITINIIFALKLSYPFILFVYELKMISFYMNVDVAIFQSL